MALGQAEVPLQLAVGQNLYNLPLKIQVGAVLRNESQEFWLLSPEDLSLPWSPGQGEHPQSLCAATHQSSSSTWELPCISIFSMGSGWQRQVPSHSPGSAWEEPSGRAPDTAGFPWSSSGVGTPSGCSWRFWLLSQPSGASVLGTSLCRGWRWFIAPVLGNSTRVNGFS